MQANFLSNQTHTNKFRLNYFPSVIREIKKESIRITCAAPLSPALMPFCPNFEQVQLRTGKVEWMKMCIVPVSVCQLVCCAQCVSVNELL